MAASDPDDSDNKLQSGFVVLTAINSNKSTHCFYLKLFDNSSERRIFPALFVQQRHVVVELTDVGGVHLQVRTLLDKDVRQSLVVTPADRQTDKSSTSETVTVYI